MGVSLATIEAYPLRTISKIKYICIIDVIFKYEEAVTLRYSIALLFLI